MGGTAAASVTCLLSSQGARPCSCMRGVATVILLNDRSVIAFGNDTNGQCAVPDALREQRVGAVAVGGYHTSSLLVLARQFPAALDLGRIAEVFASGISRFS